MRSLSKKSIIMTPLNLHHPSHSLSLAGDFLARYLLLTTFSNSNPYPYHFPSYIPLIYVQNNPTKVCFISIIVKAIHSKRTTSHFPHTTVTYNPLLCITGNLGLNRIRPRYVSNLFLCISVEIF